MKIKRWTFLYIDSKHFNIIDLEMYATGIT